MSTDPPALGIDIGSTNIKFGIVHRDGRLEGTFSVPTEAHQGAARVMDRIRDGIAGLIQRAGASPDAFAGIGIGSGGAIDAATCEVIGATSNLPGWTGMNLRAAIQQRFPLPVHADNDARAAAVAEKWFGLGKPFRSFVCVTVGTGIGGGIIMNGELIGGASHFAGLLGHQVIVKDGLPCNCGGRGCLEMYASGPAIVRLANQIEPTAGYRSSKEVAEAADRGSPGARRAIETAADYLSVGLVNLFNILDPEAIILTGGVVSPGSRLLRRLQQRVLERIPFPEKRPLRILASSQHTYSGVLGGAALVFEARQSG